MTSIIKEIETSHFFNNGEEIWYNEQRNGFNMHHYATLADDDAFTRLIAIMQSNTWFPNSTSMMSDSAQYSQLSDTDRHVFLTTISYLSVGDNAVPDNIAKYSQLMANSTVRRAIYTIIGQEALHTDSYKYVIDALVANTINKQNMYSYALQSKIVQEKINWTADYTNSLVESIGSEKEQIALFEALFAYFIFERVFFPSGFAVGFCMGVKNIMRDTAEQYRYILRDELTHAGTAKLLIKSVIKEFKLPFDYVSSKMSEMLNEAMELEIKYSGFLLPEDTVYLTSKNYNEYVSFLLNQIAKEFNVSEFKGSKYSIIRNVIAPYLQTESSNPMEVRGQSYRADCGGSVRNDL
jgi:ribonucleotide reductase beta subunit family protein with ferritin-like domain